MTDDAIYVVGAGMTPFGRFDGEDQELAETAVRAALADCGLTPADVDGMTCFGTNGSAGPSQVAHAIGVEVRQEVLSQESLEKIALEGVLRNLSVTREDTPSVINVAFSSRDPAKAAMIVNAIVDSYREAGIAGKHLS